MLPMLMVPSASVSFAVIFASVVGVSLVVDPLSLLATGAAFGHGSAGQLSVCNTVMVCPATSPGVTATRIELDVPLRTGKVTRT